MSLLIPIKPIVLFSAFLSSAFAAEKMNVLFIAIDDLRPELNCYGNSEIHSPNIDTLASQGILFERAYCQVAVCGASRASIMTGLRPQTTRCWDYKTPMREKNPNALSMPQYFLSQGYTTLSIGKVYHAPSDDFPQGWSVKPLRGLGSLYATPEGVAAYKNAQRIQRMSGVRTAGPSNENGGNVDDDAYDDGMVAKAAIERLEKLAATNTPFFLAVGFTKPHLPFNAPGKYWNLYDRAKIGVPSRNDVVNGLSYDGSDWGELKNYSDISKKSKILDDAKTRELIHGYRASVSYMDAQVGRLLTALKKTGLAKNTIVVLWGDHGYYLGDFGDWCKHTNYEIATRVPLIISAPRINGGKRTAALTELVDVFPTLCELSGLPLPTNLHGTSLVPILINPAIQWKEGVFSQYYKTKPKVGRVLGTSLRTDRFRYTEWRRVDQTGRLEDITLIDFQNDPEAKMNVADDPEYREVLERLSALAARSDTGIQPQN